MAKKLIHTELGKRFNINDVEHDLSVFIWTFKHADNINIYQKVNLIIQNFLTSL